MNKQNTISMEYYTAVKKNGTQTHTTTWMNLENFMLHEKSQYRKIVCCMIPFIKMSRLGQSVDTENR